MLKQMPIESVLDPGLVAESTKGSILEVLAVCCHDARCTEKIFSEEKQQLIDLNQENSSRPQRWNSVATTVLQMPRWMR